MSLYFFNNVPAEYLDKFCAVRDAFSNLENLLVTAEILNTCHESWNKETKDFDLLISTGTHKRILVKKTGHCCKVSDEAAFCLIQRPYISKTLLTRRISPRGSP